MACAGISTSSPVADVKRTASESPYKVAVARPRRRDAITRRPMKFFQVIFDLRRLVWAWWWSSGSNLPLRQSDCRGCIAIAVNAYACANRLAGQLPEGGRERHLRGISERNCDRDDRIIGDAQHLHDLLEPVLAQPGMRRKPARSAEA
jgi:hypothetical protein